MTEANAVPQTDDTKKSEPTAQAATSQGEVGKPAEAPKETGPKKTKFYFKNRKEMQKQPDGTEKEVTIKKPDPVELVIPELNLEDVAKIITQGDDKEKALLLEAVNAIVLAQARSLVDEDVEKARTEGIKNEELTWNFIANIPPATRRGGGIPDEVWDAFVVDYTEVMQHHGKTKEKAETGAKLLAKRFNPVKDNKKIVKALLENLMTWFTNTEKADDFKDVYETLTSKADTLLAKDEEAILAAI
jgi:hypothetical protein